MSDIVERLREKRGIMDNRWPGPSQLEQEAADEIERLRDALQDLASYELVVVGFNGAFTKTDLKDCTWMAGFAGRQPEFRHFTAARAALAPPVEQAKTEVEG